MIERKGLLTALGVVSVLLIGCSKSNQGDQGKCPETRDEVARLIGGNPEDWEKLKSGSKLREYRGVPRILVRPSIGRLWVSPSNGDAPRYLRPRQTVNAERANF